MDLFKIIERNYDLKPIRKIELTKNGSGNTFLVQTEQEKYIAKVNERNDFVHIYEKVQNKLNQIDILKSRIIKTNNNLNMTLEGIVLYEYIDGENNISLSEKQIENAIKYIKKYNKALSLISFKNEELINKNHWDKAKSLDFIVDELPNLLLKLELKMQDKRNIYYVIDILSKNKALIAKQNKQLIHSDLGADNFIFKGDKIISIIDFTPEFNHEFYSLCQFIYWNYIWHTPYINKSQINNYLRVYNEDSDINIENDMFFILLLNAALYRIVGPLLDMFSRNINDYSGLKKRFSILAELIKTNT